MKKIQEKFCFVTSASRMNRKTKDVSATELLNDIRGGYEDV